MLDGKAFGEDVVALVRGYVEREIALLRGENESLKARLAALEERPVPEKGDVGERGSDGLSPDPEDIITAFVPAAQELIAAEVAKAVGQLPTPERGEKGETGERGEAGARGSDGTNGEDGQNGKDAAGIVEALKDSGELVLTLQDGRLIRTGIRDGAKGQDGRDGIDLTSFDAVVLDDDRTIELKFVSGDEERVASFKWPTVLDCGVYRAGENYERGDAVSWGGSLWIAQKETDAKPDTADSGWRLAVKRGRDGKDGRTTRGEE